MGNYEYIIASLPVIGADKPLSLETLEELQGFIYEQLEEDDRKKVDILTDSLDPDKLGEEFYTEALKDKNRFIREYFGFDLQVRNAKVLHLNRALGRAEKMDIFMETETEPELSSTLEKIYSDPDILAKERAIDQLLWEKIDEITIFNYFDLDAVLGFVAKLHIVQRWSNLDEETGRQLFREMIQRITKK